MAIYAPQINVVNEEYDQPLNPNADGLSANGFYPQNASSSDTTAGVERDVSGNLVLKDTANGSKTLTQILSAGTGITLTTHESIDSLVHNIAETGYQEITRDSAGRASAYTFWTSAAKTTKVREIVLTRGTNGKVSSFTLVQYDGAGASITGQNLSCSVSTSNGRFLSLTTTES